jgi:hypothetical protein
LITTFFITPIRSSSKPSSLPWTLNEDRVTSTPQRSFQGAWIIIATKEPRKASPSAKIKDSKKKKKKKKKKKS